MNILSRMLCVVALLMALSGLDAFAAPAGISVDDVDIVQIDASVETLPQEKSVVNAVDVEGIAIFQVSGDYGRDNVLARAEIARRYIDRYDDHHDLIFVFSDFEFDTGDASAFASLIKNDVHGLGLPIFDSTAAFGSTSGRLQNYIDMAALSRWEMNPSSPRYTVTLDVAAHEVMHRWTAHSKYLRNGVESGDLLGRDQAHWNFFLDTDASLMYGADWRPASDGQFEAIDVRRRFSALDLYLAGLYSAAEVPEMALIRGGVGATAQDLPVLGFKTAGSAEMISVQQIIDANGVRVPSVTASPKRFSAGIILLTRPGQAIRDQALFDLQRFAIDFETRFAGMTRGRASISISNVPAQIAVSGAPPVLAGGALCTTCSLDMAQAKVWLLSRQRTSDGAFVDKAFNSVPASAAALRSMHAEGFGSSSATQSLSGWLDTVQSRQFDDLAWKQRAGVNTQVGPDTALAGTRDAILASSVPGIGPDWSGSAWDAAAVLGTAVFNQLTVAQRDVFLTRLQAFQNPDGGFGISPGGVSHVGLTAWVLNEVAPLDGGTADAITSASSAWLLTQRNADGSFGTEANAVLPTAWAIAGFVRMDAGVDVSSSVAFLRSRQSGQGPSEGSWNGSVFTTAEVIRVLGQIDKSNLSFDGVLTAAPASPVSGDRVLLRARVRNDGIVAEHVKLAWFVGDPVLAGVPISTEMDLGSLGGGQSIETSVEWDTTSLAGEHPIWAVLDRADVIDELNEDDNRQRLPINVSALPLAPDAALFRERFTLTPAAVTAYPAQIVISGQLANIGGAALTAVPVAAYAMRGGTRTELARTVLDVDAQSSVSVQLDFTLQRSDPLAFELVVDPDNSFAEIRENNNTLSFELPSTAGIDLAISTADLVQLTEPAVAGQPVRFRVTAHNNGATPSPNFVVSPKIRRGSDVHALGDISIQVDAGASVEREFVWSAVVIGEATLEVELDPLSTIADVDRSNNRATLTFSVADPSAPNIIVDAQSIQMMPSPLDQARPALLRAQIRNAGAEIASDWIVVVSSGGESGPRTELARTTVAGIAAGAIQHIELALPALPVAGDRYFFVVADPENLIPESNDSDNTAFIRASVRSIPDASVSIASLVLTPSMPLPGEPVRADVTVRNLGQQALSGLRVRLFDGDVQTGMVVSPDQIASDIHGGGTAQVSWNWTWASTGGARAISVQLDPENAIAEIREDNNLAVVNLQSHADHYATEPYISPNDDGVKESTQVVFGNLSSTPAVIDVLDVSDRIVRTWTPEEFISSAGVAVLWDGRNNEAQVVADGDYRIRALTAEAALLADVGVVVDTNRSSILEAMGTGLENYTKLLHSYSARDMSVAPLGYPDQDVVLLHNPLNLSTADPVDRLGGLHRFDLLLGTMEPVLDATWILAQGSAAEIIAMHWAEAGDYVVIVVRASNQDSVWRVRVDARNSVLRLAGPAQRSDSFPVLRSSGVSHVLLWENAFPDAFARRYRLDNGVEDRLQVNDARGNIVQVLDDGFLVGSSNTRLFFVSFDTATAARDILDAQGPGYIAHVGARGVLVHRVAGSAEAIEWRSLRDGQSRVVVQASLTADQVQHQRCVLGHEDGGWFGGELLIHDHTRRMSVLIDADTGAAREIQLPLIDRVGEYRQQHRKLILARQSMADDVGGQAAATHYKNDTASSDEPSGTMTLVRSERSEACSDRVGTASRATTNGKSDARRSVVGKGYTADNPFLLRAPESAFVLDGEVVLGFDAVHSEHHFLDGAHSAYVLSRDTGAVSRFGGYTNWPLQDASDQQLFAAIYFDENGDVYSDIRAQPQALLSEYARLTAVSDPYFSLGDGSGIAIADAGDSTDDYGVFLSGGYRTGAVFPYPERFLGATLSERYLFGGPLNEGELWFYTSLANQPVKLRARGNANGIDLLGIATDRNFHHFDLAWANPAVPDQWHAIGAAVQDPAIDTELMSWTPPTAGQYLLRLRSEDKAGNLRQVTARAISPVAADIANAQLASRYISPNGDGAKDVLSLSMDVLRPTTLRFEIRDSDGAVMHLREQQATESGPITWTWDGRMPSGQVALDGRYSVSIGDWFSTTFVIDNTPPVLDIRRLRAADESFVFVDGRDVHTKLVWRVFEANRSLIALQRGDGATPAVWQIADERIPDKGNKKLTKDDNGNYRIVAEDLAGNDAVSAPTGLLPHHLALVGRQVWNDQQQPGPWGCTASVSDSVLCTELEFFVDLDAAYPIASTNLLALDLYIAPGSPDQHITMRYRLERFGSDVPVVGPWQSLEVSGIDRQATELQLRAVAPTLPLRSLITIQATARNSSGVEASVSTKFEYAGISDPRIYDMDQRCVPAHVEEGLPAANWVCVEEGFLGTARNPTLTVIGVNGNVLSEQRHVRIIDGVVLFEQPHRECRELIARMQSPSGRVYQSRVACTPSNIDYLATIHPDPSMSCGDAPHHRMKFRSWFSIFNDNSISGITGDIVLPTGSRRFASVEYPLPAPNCAPSQCGKSAEINGVVDVSDLADGNYTAIFTVRFHQGGSFSQERGFSVDRTPAVIDIRRPADGEKICLNVHGGNAPPISVDVAVSDLSGVSQAGKYTHAPSSSSSTSFLPDPRGWPLYGCRDSSASTKNALPDTLCRPLNGLIHFDQSSLLPPNGNQYLMHYAALNWGGSPQCRAVRFEADEGADFDVGIERAPARRREPVPVDIDDSGRLPVINPTGASEFRKIDLQMDMSEPLLVRMELWSTGWMAERISILHDGVQYAEGAHPVSWNGENGSGGVVADGIYALKFFAEDDCGHVRARVITVVVDTTVPQVSFGEPVLNQVFNTLFVPVEMSAIDLSGGAFDLTVESASSIPLRTGTLSWFGVDPPARPLVFSWNRGDISGPVLMRVVATDVVGNRSVTEVPIQLGPRSSSLFDIAEVVPALFSPNGDAQFDRVDIRYALTTNADVSARVLRADGSLLTTLQNAEPRLAGNHTMQWSGQSLPTSQADGSYRIALHAVNPIDPAQFEEVLLPLVVDGSPPELAVLRPATAYSQGVGTLDMGIAEPHFQTATWQLGGRQGVLPAAGESSLIDLAELDEGAHTLVVDARDMIANSAQLQHALTIDRTDPLALLTAPEEAAVLGGAIAEAPIEGTASDLHLERFTLGIAPAQSLSNEVILADSSTSVSAGGLHALSLARPDGEYQLRLQVHDMAGRSAEALRRIHIDHTAPIATLTEPANNAYVQRRFHVSGTASDLHLADYRLRIATPDQASVGLWSDLLIQHASVSSGVLGTVDLPVADGDYFLELIARDKVGLSAANRIRIRLDSTAPVTPIALVGHRDGEQDVALAWQDNPPEDFAGYQVYRDGSKLSAALIAGRSYLDRSAPNGVLRYEVSAIDRAGNESARSNAAIVVVDRTPPDAALMLPADGALVSGVLDIVGTAFSESDFDRYRVSLLDVHSQATVQVLAESTRSVRAGSFAALDTRLLEQGAVFNILLEAHDHNGNRATDSVRIIIDNLPPAAPTGLLAVDVGGDGDVRWDANSESDLLGYVLLRDGRAVNGGSVLPDDLRVLAIPDIHYLDPQLVDGTHTWVVFAIDRAGNLSPPSAPAQLEIARRPPDIRINEPGQDHRFDGSVRMVAVSDDLDIAQVWFDYRAVGAVTWTPLGNPLTQLPYSVTWTPESLPRGAYEIRAQVRDIGGLEDDTPAIVRVHHVDLQAPPQVQGLDAHADGGDVVLSWTSVDAADIAHYRVERSWYADDGFSQVAIVAAGTTTVIDSGVSDGTHYYRVLAEDAAGNVGSASAVDAAIVFAVEVDTPLSPIRESEVVLTGKTPVAGVLEVTRAAPGTPERLLQIDIERDDFVLPVVPLLAGQNQLVLRVKDADQNISRIAEAWVNSSGVPSAPTGLVVAVSNHDVAASWNANPEPDIAGYRLFRRGFPVMVERDLDDLLAVGQPDDGAQLAVDGDPQSAWLADSWFGDGVLSETWLELMSTAPRLISGVTLTWLGNRKPVSFDVMAFSGHAWVRLASVSQVQNPHVLRFSTPYRSSQLRVVPTAAINGQSIALAEVVVSEQPLIDDTEYLDRVIDGSYPYEVSAVNEAGFEGPRSAPAIAEVGDAQAPEAVVLSGQVQARDALLSWTASNSSDVVRYQVVRDGVHRVYVDVPQLAYTDGPLANGSYAFTVVALDAFGNVSAPSNVVVLNIDTNGPSIPENLRVVAPPRGAVLDVTWQPVAGDVVAHYLLRRSLSQAGPFAIVADTPLLQWLDEPLVNDTRYWYTVEALDAAGNASGQTAPVSGVPQDQQALLPPILTFPVHDGERIDLHASEVLVAGIAEAGARVDIRHSGSAITQAASSVSDQVRVLNHGGVIGRLHAAPSGSMYFGADSQDVHDAVSGQYRGQSPSGPIQGWARNDHIVVRASDGNWISHDLSGGESQSLDLSLANVEAARFSSDLRYALALGAYPVNGSATRALWFVDRSLASVRRVAGVDPDSVDFASIVFSETSGHAAWRSNAGELIRLRFNTVQARAIAADVAPVRASLSARNGEALHVRLLSSEAVVHRVDAAGVSRVIGPGRVAAWSPDGDQYVVAESDGVLAFHLASDDAVLKRLDLDVAELIGLDWTQSGRLLVHTSAGMRAIDPAGHFRSTPVALIAGENSLDLYAFDGAGHGQSSRDPGVVRVAGSSTPTQLADLGVLADHIRFLPAAGLPGQAYAAQVTVRNHGNVASATTATRIVLIRPDGTQTLLPNAPTVPVLGAGGNTTFGVALGTLALAGSYWMSVELLVDAADGNPANHFASQRLIVSANAEPLLELTVDAANFAPGVDATGSVRVRNVGSPWNGRVQMRILNQRNELLAELPALAVNDLAFGAETAQAWRWNTASAFAGGYRVQADLLDAQSRVVSTRSVDFGIAVLRDLRLDVVSDRLAYVPGDSVRLNATLDYRSGNSVVSGAALRLRVLDPSGLEVYASTRALATLLPGYRIQIPGSWMAAGSPGVYALHAELLEGNAISVLAQGSFLINAPDGTLMVTGTIEPVPAPLIAGRPGRVDYRLLNASSTAIVVDALRLRLLRAAGMEEVAVHTVSGSAAAQGQLQGSLLVDESSLVMGEHLAVLDWRATPSSQPVMLAMRSISVLDGIAPVISLRTPDGNGWVRAQAVLGAQVNDAHSGVDLVEVSVDGGNWLPAPLRGQGLYGTDSQGLSDGAHRFRFRARDRAGNESISDERVFQVDNTPPRIVISGVNDGDVVAHPVTPLVAIEETHPGESTIALNAAAFVSGSTLNDDGRYLLTVAARDLAGNTAAVSVGFEIDTVAPALAFVAPLDGDETTFASIEARLQTEPMIAVALTASGYAASVQADASGTASLTGVPLVFGVNELVAVATDFAGNESAPVRVRVTRVDNSGAALVGSLSASAPVFVSGTPATLNWQLLNPQSAPSNGLSRRVRVLHVNSGALLGEESAIVDVPGNGQISGSAQFATDAAALGRYAATLSVRIGSDYVQLATAEFVVQDAEPPQLTLIAPAHNALINQPLRVHATASDGLGSVSAVRYRIDVGALVPMTAVAGSPDAFESALLDLPDADYLIHVEAEDNAGNITSPLVHAFSVDRTPPLIDITNVAAGGAYATEVVPQIAISDLHPGTRSITLDGQPFVSGTPVNGEGAHVLNVRATDAAGNSSERSVGFRIDRTAPVIAFSFPDEGAVVATAQIDVGGLTEPHVRVAFRIGSQESSVFADDLGGFIVPAVSLQIGSNLLQARAIDALGNASDWISRSIEYRPNAGAHVIAELTLSSVELPLGDVLTASYLLRNDGTVPVTAMPMRVRWVRVADQSQLSEHPFALTLAPAASSNGSVQLLSADTLPGAHVVVLEGWRTASDGWQALATAQVIVLDVLAPVVSLIEPAADSYVDTGFTLRARASDVHSTIALVQGLVAAAPIALQPGAIAGEHLASIKVASEGPLQISARAVDSAGNTAEAAMRQVIVDLLPPRIDISGVVEGALHNQPVTLHIDITDVSPVQSVITMDGLAFSSGGTVTAEGAHLLRVRATDALGRVSESLRSFTIDVTAPGVQITVPEHGAIIFADSTRVAGITEAFADVALDVGSFNAALTADASGIFSIDNVPLAPGQNRITARATDRAGNVGNQAFVEVERRGQPVVALQGHIGLTSKEWPNGSQLTSSFSLHNIGTAALSALPVRIEARRRDSQQLLDVDALTIDLLAAAQSTHAFEWGTGNWGLGAIDIALIADMPGQASPLILDTHALLLVDREAPTLRFETPVADQRMHVGDPVRVIANDRLSEIANVEVRIDNADWMPLSALDVLAGRYGSTLPVIALGPHQLTARTRDAAGNVASTQPLPIMVVGMLPLTVSAPLDGSTTEAAVVTFTGLTSANATVRIHRNGSEWQAQADATGAFSVPDVPLIEGQNRFVLRAEDGFGNVSANLSIAITATGTVEPIAVPIGGWHIWWLLTVLMIAMAYARMRVPRTEP